MVLPLGITALLAAQNEYDARLGRQRDVADSAADPSVVGVQLKRDETNVRLAAVIGEGFHNVFVFVDHMQLFGDQRQQRALERNGKQHHAENHMEQVVLRLRFADRRHNGEYDGGRAAEAREGDDRDRVALRAEGKQQRRNGQRPRDKGKEQEQQHRRQNDGGHLGREGKQAQQEEDGHLRDAGHPVEVIDERFFVVDGRVAQNDAEYVGAQIPVAAEIGGYRVSQQRERRDVNRLKALRAGFQTFAGEQPD